MKVNRAKLTLSEIHMVSLFLWKKKKKGLPKPCSFLLFSLHTDTFYLFFFIATQDRRKKKNTGDSHLIYGRLSAFLIRMLFSKSTCQWHTIKTAFLIRIFMQWRYFSLMEIYKCELTLWVRKKRSAWGVSFRLIVSFLKIFIIDLENGVCSWILWKSN